MSENINKMMEDLKIISQKEDLSKTESISAEYIDYFGKLHDAYIRYNYILENVDLKNKTLLNNNIKTFIDDFIEYKTDPFLLYNFVKNIDCQIELELFYLFKL